MALNFKLLKQWWDKDLTFKMLIPSSILLALGILFNISIFAYIACVLLFTIFDVFGFYLTEVIGQFKENSSETVPYRIIQVIFEIVLAIILLIQFDWSVSLAFLICWWFGTCDLLFYLFKQIVLKNDDNLFWLNGWSVFYILEKLGNKQTTPNQLYVSSIIGFTIGLILCVV